MQIMLFTQPALPPNLDKPLTSIIRPAEEKPKPREYLVIDGDNLTKIAEAQTTTVARLWAKNTDLKNPDLLEIGTKLVIPTSDEILPDRPLPTENLAEPIKSGLGTGNTTGNGYSYGYCTYLVKNLRPDLPNNLGDASSWLTNARSQGLAVGDTPRAGAVAVALRYGHVAYVTAVHGDSVTITEENYVGWNVISTRTAPASEFGYIY